MFFFQAEDGIRDIGVTGVQTCALPIWAQLFNVRTDISSLSSNIIYPSKPTLTARASSVRAAPRWRLRGLGQSLMVASSSSWNWCFPEGETNPDPSLDLLGRCTGDRKSTRLNSSHANISYAVFCLKKK